ncbi:hypothetical protein [Fibrobacter sp. UBA4297]|uniref:hypothetical protein n=1 Tax=Fibrobacter sp. UBA4297 TaxID=1946536 RepID=UPI0025C2C0ED|nr:hypothetical protein [Fibrobacter sp. UBA4297]
MLKYKTQEQLDSLRTFCDTIFVHSVVNVYKDTVYDDTVITDNKKYTSFIYFDRYTEKKDTLVSLTAEKSGTSGPCGRVPVYCNLDSSDTQKTFSCEISSMCYMYNQTDNLATSSAEVAVVRLDPVLITNEPLCSQPGFRCVRDTVFHDAFHTTYRTIALDTTFLNYGANAWTDYVPAVNAPAFDTAAFRNALDTLDTQKPIFGIDTLFTGYSVSVEGLPDWASTRKKETCKAKDSTSICIIKVTEMFRPYGLANTYPTPYFQSSFYLTNYLEAPLEKDTLITWKLKYSYYNGHSFKGNSGSLEITTLFKGI